MDDNTLETITNHLNNLDDLEKNPLIFSDEDGNPANLGIKKQIKEEKLDLGDLIRIILTNKTDYYSRNQETKDVETEPERHRSALDIWRHVIFYKKNVTLPEVMNKLFEMQDDLRIQFCHRIQKRVFDLVLHDDDYHVEFDHIDEFGLTFNQWE